MTRRALAALALALAVSACGGDDDTAGASSDPDQLVLAETRARADELGMDPAATDRLEDTINELGLDYCDEDASRLVALAVQVADVAEETRDVIEADLEAHVDEHC